jgi:hypothetical protein
MPPMREYAQISSRALAIASGICVGTLRPLQHRGENVKFFELVPLNGRKQRPSLARWWRGRNRKRPRGLLWCPKMGGLLSVAAAQMYTPEVPVVQAPAAASNSSGLNLPQQTQQSQMLDSKCAKPVELRDIGARSFLLR